MLSQLLFCFWTQTCASRMALMHVWKKCIYLKLIVKGYFVGSQHINVCVLSLLFIACLRTFLKVNKLISQITITLLPSHKLIFVPSEHAGLL